ncbi:Phage major capsid protein E [Serratia rubidaea]|uniref:Phage major capsid protein E n=1 Tax=Serratia rubidaea TaxID=61652 RepID=A0A3S4H392_SERRU|nr:Phage major capsid protein E [Serratia rubidaea]
MSMYSTTKLIAVTETKFKFDPLFLRLFYRESYEFDTETVDLAKLPGEVEMAVYISPTVEGKVLRTRGGLTTQFKPGYLKPKHEVNPQMLLRRLPDEDPEMLKDPAYRRQRIILQNLKDEELAIAQIEEKQAVDGVISGKYIMTGDQFEPVEVDLQRSPENNIVQAGDGRWSTQDKETYDPTGDLEAYAQNASGIVNLIVMDPKAWAQFQSFKAVQKKLDTRRGSVAYLETALQDLGKAVSVKGMYGDVAIIVYVGQYIDPQTKQKTNYMPANTLVLGNNEARGIRTYGAIQDIEAINEGITKARRYPKNWVQRGDPAREYTMTQTAPLMVLADADEFVVVTIA